MNGAFFAFDLLVVVQKFENEENLQLLFSLDYRGRCKLTLDFDLQKDIGKVVGQ